MRIAHIPPMRVIISHTTRLIAVLILAALMPARSTGEMHPTPPLEGRSPVTGIADVTDGDTVVINGTRIRLEGIDAPEAGQMCGTRAGGSWPCGASAATALRRLVEGKAVRCDPLGIDRYGRMLGACFLGEVDVNALMVRRGHAWAFVRYSESYAREEQEARAERVGIWQGEALPAWEYRARRWAGVEQRAPNGCAIKGNVTANGKIYHMPWSPWYARIRMDPARGRRWFCTEAEALAAGWRPVNLN